MFRNRPKVRIHDFVTALCVFSSKSTTTYRVTNKFVNPGVASLPVDPRPWHFVWLSTHHALIDFKLLCPLRVLVWSVLLALLCIERSVCVNYEHEIWSYCPLYFYDFQFSLIMYLEPFLIGSYILILKNFVEMWH